MSKRYIVVAELALFYPNNFVRKGDIIDSSHMIQGDLKRNLRNGSIEEYKEPKKASKPKTRGD